MAVKGSRSSSNKRYRNKKMSRSLSIRVKGYKRAGKKVKGYTKKVSKMKK